jgi:hypothetical protein
MRKQWTLIAAAIAAGFAGGALSNGVGKVFAQERTHQITAERFVVADFNGTKRGELGLDARGRINLTLYDDQGRVIWSAPVRGGVFPVSPLR